MMKRFGFFAAVLLGLMPAASRPLSAQSTGPQQIAVAGLRASGQQGQFNGVIADKTGNLFLLLDEQDGVRVLKTDGSATTVLASALLGAAGDSGLSMALDPAGNVYVTGTSQSGSLTATSGAAFLNPVGTTPNAFVAKFDASLNLVFVTFGGANRIGAPAIAATADAVFIAGIIYNDKSSATTACPASYDSSTNLPVTFYSNNLPVTPSAIGQCPAYNSGQNGFVERFSTDGKTLVYATYLSGATASTTLSSTTPLAIAVDADDNAYIGGFTTATGFPTIAALIPRTTADTTGFLLKLTPQADGITFSTYIPGAGIGSLAIDTVANNLLLSGDVALGQFPVSNVSMPVVTPSPDVAYQVLLRMPLDGTSVLSSTLLAPASHTAISTGPAGTVWVDGTLASASGSLLPLLPLAPSANLGTAFALRVSPSSAPGGTVVDRTARFGGLAAANPNYASLPLTLNAVTVDSTGAAVMVGGVAPTASASLLNTQTFDLPLTNAPTTGLPSSVHDAVVPPASCTNSSACTGGAAYLARVLPTAGASLAFSTDSSPLIVLRNLGSAQATLLVVAATGFSQTSTCGSTLAAGDECTIVLSGGGPGTITANATNATTQTVSLAAVASGTVANTLAFSPRELDYGVQSAASPMQTRTITVTNLGQYSQTFSSKFNGPTLGAKYSYTQASSDCGAGLNPTSKIVAAGATCHIVIGLTASSDAAKDGIALANWSIGTGNVLLTGYTQAAALSLSATTIDFGTQFHGGLTSPRFLYLSNNAATAQSHTPLTSQPGSPFSITDRCPAQLEPHTVCQIAFGYLSPVATSTDSAPLTLDQNLSLLVTGSTLPAPTVGGASAPPTLSVGPAAISFATPVVLTTVSDSTQTVTVANTGTSSFALALTLAGDFTDQTTCGATLAGNSSCNVVITFAPTQPGARTGLLAITAGGDTTPVNVPLSGTGTAILPPNNGTLDFGNVPVGQPAVQWYKVSQSFTALTAYSTLTGTSSFHAVLVEDIGYGHGTPASSSFLTATTGSCTNCWLGVQFLPPSPGGQMGTLTLSSSPSGPNYILNLTGAGFSESNLQLTPVNQDFGTVAVHSVSAPLLYTLTNLSATNAAITVSTPTVAGDFTLSTAPTAGAACGGTLAVNASCFIQIVFAPTATGQETGTLTVQTSAGTATASLTGFGAPDPGVAFNPTGLVFQSVPGTTATLQTITVTNTGSSALQVGTPTNANAAFSATSACPGSLAPAAQCTLMVTYAPGGQQVKDTLQVPVTANTGGGPVLTTYPITLAGTYTAGTGLQILPAVSNFGPAAVYTVGGTRQFTINNLTAKDVTVNVTLPREFVPSGAPCGGLAANASCTFSVSFVPVTNGNITGTLLAQGVPSDQSATLNGLGNLLGYGTGSTSLAVTGNIAAGRVVNFGQVASGQSGQQVLTITNNSNPAGAATTVTVRRVSAVWPFVSTTTCGGTLTIGQSCTLTINYTPLNQVTAGGLARTDTQVLTIESDAASAPDQLNLTGIVPPVVVATPSNAAPTSLFTASQNALTFSTTPAGLSSAAQTVTLANLGNTTLHITNVAASADFKVVADAGCSAVLPGTRCGLTITFTPQVSTQAAGPRAGAVEISSDAAVALEFLSLLGDASPSTLVFKPLPTFGVQVVGTTVTQSFTITNAGTTAATFNGITVTGDYAVSGNCPASGASLAVGATCTVQVAFTPTTTGVRNGVLSIASSATTTPLTMSLSGTGVQSHLQINPVTLNFSNVTVNSSGSQTLTLANTGTAPISNIAYAFGATGTGAAGYAVIQPCSLATLSPGASCSVTVAFNPLVAGTSTNTLVITSSDPTSPDSVPLTGVGVAGATTNAATFTLTVDGGAASTQTVSQTRPATYTLTLTPVSGYTGSVVLGCNAVTVAPYATCSMPQSTVTLAGGTSQTAVVTINTITSASLRAPILKSLNQTAMCILAPSALLFWRFRKILTKRPASLFLAMIYAAMIVLASGCGSSGNTNLRITPSGTYQYMVTATSTSAGTSASKTVTLNLIIP